MKSDIEIVRRLVMEHGWNSTAYQILNPGILYWLAGDASAVVGYVRRGRVLLAAGSPVCRESRLAAVAGDFEAFARSQGCSVCYVCAHARLKEALAERGDHAAVALGAQPVWNPQGWPALVRSKSSLRAQLNRARNKGVVVEELPWLDARGSPELRRCIDQWLGERGLPPLHFLVEPHVLDGVLADRVFLAAKRNGRIVAFLAASPIAMRPGYLVEEIARVPEAPNGTSELLIDAAMRQFAGTGIQHVTLGLVALANIPSAEIGINPAWLRAMMAVARVHANRFYNFRGLLQFRQKMLPDLWEPIYAVSNERRFSLRTLYAIGGAFSGISPVAAVFLGAVRALRQELVWLARE